MRKKILKAINRTKSYLHSYSSNQTAFKLLKSIESEKGRTSKKHINLSNEYALDVFGSQKYAPWLYVYSAMNSEFKEGWIPDNYFSKVVLPNINGEYGKISRIKPFSKMIFKSDFFPDIAYYVNGLFLDASRKPISYDSLKNNIFKESNSVIFKIDNSAGGRGVFVFTASTFNEHKIRRLGNGVFQSFIEQHPFFDLYMPNSVATIRLTTTINDLGKHELKASFLRFGMDNHTYVKSDDSIWVPVDTKSGVLNNIGYLANWIPIDEHPDTNIPFSGKVIPFFEECKKTAINLHEKIPYARCVGWDMVIDKNNKVNIMEWNGSHPDIKFSEAMQGPCFNDLGWENLWRS